MRIKFTGFIYQTKTIGKKITQIGVDWLNFVQCPFYKYNYKRFRTLTIVSER